MTITPRPDHEEAIQQAIENGLIRSVDDLIPMALASPRQKNSSAGAVGREAIERMREFGEHHQLILGEPITRDLLHEGHRY